MTARTHDDGGELRTVLRTGLADAAHETARTGDSEALQARVLAQWQQRHPVAQARLAQAGGATLHSGGLRYHRLWWAAGALVVTAALVIGTAPWQRPDPALDELLQMDVLTLISMGEI